jgi:hypothetical protein
VTCQWPPASEAAFSPAFDAARGVLQRPRMPPSPAAAGAIAGPPLGLATAHSSVLVGLDANAIRVEVCCTRGPAFFQMVGLAEAAVREARVRVASALAGLGVLLDEYAVTVNLAPADLRKTGASLDVAIAVATLAATGHLPRESLDNVLPWLRRTRGRFAAPDRESPLGTARAAPGA